MNRQEMIDDTAKAYLDSVCEAGAETWIENVLRYGRKDKGLENMTDEELKEYHGFWVGCCKETK